MAISNLQQRLKRKVRIRSRIHGTAARPRLTVYRSIAQVTVQLVDDDARKTIIAASTKELKAKPNKEGGKKLGALVAKKAKTAGISAVVFDRNGYAYHGVVREVADGARSGGLTF